MFGLIIVIVLYLMNAGSIYLFRRHWGDAEDFAEAVAGALSRFWPVKKGRFARMPPSFQIMAVGVAIVSSVEVWLRWKEARGLRAGDLDLASASDTVALVLGLFGFAIILVSAGLAASTGWWGKPRRLLFPFLRDEGIPWLDDER